MPWRLGRAQSFCSRAAVLIAALAAALAVAPQPAAAQGFFDFLFGGQQQQPPPPNPELPPPPPGIGRVAPAPLGPERVNEGAGSTGHTVAFCVRLCDGQHFPLEQMANTTPVETCRAICPKQPDQGLFRRRDRRRQGERRRRIIPISRPRFCIASSCSPIAPATAGMRSGLCRWTRRPIRRLRPGDVVSTKEGLETYSGKTGKSGAFTPVSPAALGPQLNSDRRRRKAERRRPAAAIWQIRHSLTAMQNASDLLLFAARTRICPA